MDPTRYQQIKSIFMEALDVPPSARDRFLIAACGDDPGLRGEVESLLQQAIHDEFLEPISSIDRDPLIGATVRGYRILRVLGEGGMGVVYLAEDERLGRRAALKFLKSELVVDASAKARFVREARAGAALEHPNICPVYAVDETADGQLFLAMRFYEGETLRQRLARGPIPLETSLDIAAQIANGLDAAHRAGIVHRDVKPGNVLLADGSVKIVDFGIAKVRDHDPLTVGGGVLGTADYMSPEQAEGTTVDHRTDVWSLGVVLSEMVGGESGQGRDTSGAHLPSDVSAIISRATATRIGDRYQSMADFAAALEVARRRLQRAPDERVDVARPRRGLRVVVTRDGRVTWSGEFVKDELIIGRAPHSDVVLNVSEVSWTHAVVRRDRQGDLFFTDRSSNGSFQHGRRVLNASLGSGGVISIPPFDVEVSTLEHLHPETVRPSSPLTDAPGGAQLRCVRGPYAVLGRVIGLAEGKNTIGRAEECGVWLDVPSISRYHAIISSAEDGAWTLEDTGSRNGVELNGVPVQRATVRFGDHLGLGSEIVSILEARAPCTISAGVSSVDPRVSTIRLAGRVDSRASVPLQEQIAAAIGFATQFLIIDLSECSSCDQSGFAVFVGIDVTLRRRGGSLYLVGLNGSVTSTYVSLRLEGILSMRNDEAAAVSALRSILDRL